MSEILQLGDISIELTRKAVKHVHLSVHPPEGQVSLVAPTGTRTEVARAYAISRLAWIRAQQARFATQVRETPRRFVARESHYLWGRRYLLSVEQRDAKPEVRLDHRRITLMVRPGSTEAARAKVMHEWHKSLLHEVVPRLIARWEPRLGVRVAGSYY
jgi:predicted metal-dependent hydrolase